MDERDIFLSVIIPVYNVAAYLPACLDSIVGQETGGEVEIILVDDGSTDGSAIICDEYAARDRRISVIRQQNGGASSARNAGIAAASGEYLLFIDGDDFIRPGSLGVIMDRVRAAGPCDVTFLNADRIDERGVAREWSCRYRRERVYQKRPDEVLAYLVGLSRYPVSPCVKLLRRGFVVTGGLFFTEGVVCEDVDHTYGVLLAAESFNAIDCPYYVARVREGSVMTARENAQKRFGSTLCIMNKWIGVAHDSARKQVILAFLAAEYLYLCALYADLPPAERKRHKKTVEGLSWLLAHGVNRKFIVVRLVYRLSKLRIFSYTMKRILR